MKNHADSPEPQPSAATADATVDATAAATADDGGALPSLTAPCRRDGWTPFCRKLFLEVLAETGRVSRACEYAQLSVSSAYALRHRDPVFAASWDAACELARSALADALYERALDGSTETITRNGEVIAERHRHDSRLSIAVLNRLDKRCDRAAETGARHLPIVEHWDQWLDLVGKGAEAEAAAGLGLIRSANAPGLQLPQLPLGANPTHVAFDGAGGDEDGAEDALDLSHRCWLEDEDDPDLRRWMTDFPPPPGFAGCEQGRYGDEDYRRECSDEEAALLDAGAQAAEAEERSEQEQLRDTWFAALRADAAAGPGGAAGSQAD